MSLCYRPKQSQAEFLLWWFSRETDSADQNLCTSYCQPGVDRWSENGGHVPLLSDAKTLESKVREAFPPDMQPPRSQNMRGEMRTQEGISNPAPRPGSGDGTAGVASTAGTDAAACESAWSLNHRPPLPGYCPTGVLMSHPRRGPGMVGLPPAVGALTHRPLCSLCSSLHQKRNWLRRAENNCEGVSAVCLCDIRAQR